MTKVTLDMDNREVKQRTGHVSMAMLCSVVFMVCEGDENLIHQRYTSLTWLEECFFSLSLFGTEHCRAGGKHLIDMGQVTNTSDRCTGSNWRWSKERWNGGQVGRTMTKT